MLRQIQEAAIDSKTDIATLLRRCQVLAYRVDHDELKDWVQHELNGYPPEAPLPEYRRMSLGLTGTFFGSFGSALRGVPIAPAALPKKLAELLKDHPLPAPIAEYQALAESGKDLQVSLSGDAVILVGHNVYRSDYSCVEAQHTMPAARLRGLIDTVRTRVLTFALELGRRHPELLDDRSAASLDVPRETITQIFHMAIVGDNANVAVGTNPNAQSAVGVLPQDFESLSKYLRAQQVEESDIEELRSALTADSSLTPTGALGSRVSGWIGKMAAKAAGGVWKAGLDVGAKVLQSAIMKYYGLS